MRNRADHMLRAAAVGIVGLAISASGAGAALSPYYQSVREIEAIVGDQRVGDAFKYVEPILSITTTGDDVYVVRTARCVLTVTIVDKPSDPGLMGPRQFDLQVGEADCQ